MDNQLLIRLKESISYLEESIHSAMSAMKGRGASGGTLNRIQEYFKLVEAQKKYIAELEKKIVDNDLSDLSRLVSLINGISGMIKEDAKTLLDEITNLNKKDDTYDC